MLELLQNAAFVFWGSITLICVVPTVAHYWYKLRKHEIDAALKREMIERGMTADEIQKVLDARPQKTHAD
jgi:hypothetical protein